MREEFKIHRDLILEKKLKELIKDLENIIDTADQKTLEEKFAKANSLIQTRERVLDEYTVQYYYSWTSLDGLVGELTLDIPKVEDIEKEDLKELICWMRKIISKEETLEGVDYEYFDNFYRGFFNKNFVNGEEAYSAIFEDVSVDDVIEIAYDSKSADGVILL